MTTEDGGGRYLLSYQKAGLVIGFVLLGLVLMLPPPEGMTLPAWRTVGVVALMATWWATEAIPVPVTSLLPIVLFPVLGVTSISSATLPYSDPIIYLLLGGFIIALALERWNLHRRLALMVLTWMGDRPNAIIFGFMVATAVLSMWVSNTASAMMMLPIAVSVSAVVCAEHGDRTFGTALALAIAYSASIGGLGTLVGTPPNAMAAAYLANQFGIEIGFLQWMMLSVPVVMVMIPAAWFVLTRWSFRINLPPNPQAAAIVAGELAAMGTISTPERRTAVIFAGVGLAWVTRPLLQMIPGFEAVSDTGIAIAGAVIMFLIPSGDGRGNFLLNWEATTRLPWGVVVLFGSGLSIAAAVSDSGLAAWIGANLNILTSLPLFVVMIVVITIVIFLTELTSNTGTTATILPILGIIAVAGGYDPVMIAAPAALAATSAFMLPVATGPNAVVFASGDVTIPQMVRAGFRLNLLGIVILGGLAYFIVPFLR